MIGKIRVLVVGCGNMGTSHALAYQGSPHFEIAGLVSRSPASREKLSTRLGGYPVYGDYLTALRDAAPEAVCISTYPDTHAEYARAALERGLHVFLEKPIATKMDEARELVRLSNENNAKLVVGYILQQHPSWITFVEEARRLGKPLVMRMNLNQQSFGPEWETHKSILKSASPLVDCGVHYMDVMCRMTDADPVKVHAIGARLSQEIAPDMYNYGQLQVIFADGSIGWYEAGWGPMMSQTAHFIKDVIGPLGSVSLIPESAGLSSTSEVHSHTKTDAVFLHSADSGALGGARADKVFKTDGEPSHDELCALEQRYFAEAIHEKIDLGDHLRSALRSLQIVLAADESIKTGDLVKIQA